jgi:hypothetical protein
MRYQYSTLICFTVLFGFVCDGFAAIAYNESVSGDVSNDPQAPTPFNLALGLNSFIATMPGSDVDFFTVNVPVGGQLSSLFMAGYSGIDEISFIAIGAGTQMPAAVLAYDPTGLLGYAHFGPGVSDLGSDLLPDLAVANFGVPGFTTPLASGSYTFWLQQESNTDTGYQLDFSVTAVPEPASAGLLLVASCGFALRRRRA